MDFQAESSMVGMGRTGREGEKLKIPEKMDCIRRKGKEVKSLQVELW